MAAKTLYDKLWYDHVVHDYQDGTVLLYIDRHLLHEVTSPQAFSGLRIAQRPLWRVDANLAVTDHNVPTTDRSVPIQNAVSKLQVDTLDRNCDEYAITQFKINDRRQGIVHVIGPEQGATLPGMSVVCGDSHTSTHGAFACLATGIGTSEVEHVMATQCLLQQRMKNMRVRFNGRLGIGVTAKDMALALIGAYGTAGGIGYAVEFTGEAVRALSIEGRMTLCNMSIEFGARNGMVAVDKKTIDYFEHRPFAPQGDQWHRAIANWRNLHSDEEAVFDAEIELDASRIEPQVTWGTSPEMVVPINGRVPDPKAEADPVRRQWMENALRYMDLQPDIPITDITIDKVFIGSCTNSRIEDLRAAAKVVDRQRVADNVRLALVVPGSRLVKLQAEHEGLHYKFIAAGFEWRESGCSMCLGMNDDRLAAGERCASTSNRNFEGRQGAGGQTHLISPAMAAAAAIKGHFVDVRKLQ